MAKLGYQNSETLEPMNIKFGTGDYVGDNTSHARIQSSRPNEGVPAHGWNITRTWFLFFPFFVTLSFAHIPRPTRRHNTDFQLFNTQISYLFKRNLLFLLLHCLEAIFFLQAKIYPYRGVCITAVRTKMLQHTVSRANVHVPHRNSA